MKSPSRMSIVTCILCVVAIAPSCSDARAAVPSGSGGGAGNAPAEPTTRTFFELATQVTAANLSGLLRLDGAAVESGVGSALLLNSKVVEGGTFSRDAGAPHVEGGNVIGTMHGMCTNVGGALSLTEGGDPGRVGKCEQALNVYGQGQIILSGLIEQDRFEAGVPQTLAVTGGTGAFQGALGEMKVTQMTFPGIVKKLELSYRAP